MLWTVWWTTLRETRVSLYCTQHMNEGPGVNREGRTARSYLRSLSRPPFLKPRIHTLAKQDELGDEHDEQCERAEYAVVSGLVGEAMVDVVEVIGWTR